MLRSSIVSQVQHSTQESSSSASINSHCISPNTNASPADSPRNLKLKEKSCLEAPDYKSGLKKMMPIDIMAEPPSTPYSPQSPNSRAAFTSPITRQYPRFSEKYNKYTLTSPSVKREKCNANYPYHYPSISPVSEPSCMVEGPPNEIQLSMQLMETYRPTLVQLFDDLLNINSTEPYFLTRLFSLLPYFSNHYTRQRLLLNLESLIQSNQESIPWPSTASEPASRSPSVRSTYAYPDVEIDESTKAAIEEVIKGVLDKSDEIRDEHIDLIITIMHKLMDKRFTDTLSHQRYNQKIKRHLRLYRNTKKSPHVIDCMADILTNICIRFIVQSNMRPQVEDIEDWSSEAVLKPTEFTQISQELEELQNQQKKLSEQLQRFEVERQALQALSEKIDTNEPDATAELNEDALSTKECKDDINEDS